MTTKKPETKTAADIAEEKAAEAYAEAKEDVAEEKADAKKKEKEGAAADKAKHKEKITPELKVTKAHVLQAAKDATADGNYERAIEVAKEYLSQDDAPDKHFVEEHLAIIKQRAGA